MNNLIIGDSSQLSYYFPDSYVRINSRDINFESIKKIEWDSVYLCLGESNKFIEDINQYDKINFDLTVKTIEELKDNSKKIVVYSTCELWNKKCGQININDEFDFFETPYLLSKYKLTTHVLQNYNNVNIMFPFNFNSIRRTKNFLFGKIFDSVINKTKIEIGDTYFYRDIIHPKFVVQESIDSTTHKIIGSGRLTFVNDFIRDIYKNFDMNYDDYVSENKTSYKEYDKVQEYYLQTKNCSYDYTSLLSDTIFDLKQKIIK